MKKCRTFLVTDGMDWYGCTKFDEAQDDIAAKTSGFGIGELGRVPSGETPTLRRSLKGLDCHYCGMPATGWGFFDEPVCEDCGG